MNPDRLRLLAGPLLLACLLASPWAGASTLFEQDSVLEVQLEGPLQTIFASKRKEKERPFVLTLDGVASPVRVSVRGKSRKRVCKFPPLRLRFEDDAEHEGHKVGKSPFDGYTMLRLVTHCNRSEAAQENAIKEFIAYRILNLVTDASYRVRLLRIRYVDTSSSRKKQVTERYGFITEPEQELAQRVQGQLATRPFVYRSALDPEHSALVYVFQYLIGNTDWSLVTAADDEFCCHNGQLIERDATLFYVPYDLDLAGLVDAHYAKPDHTLPIRRVTQRLYRGLCVPREVLQAALRKLQGRRQQIMGLLQDVPGLSGGEVKKQTQFLQRFFDEAANEQKLIKNFEAKCIRR